MATPTTTAEFRKMQIADLRRDIAAKRNDIARRGLAVHMRSEKNTATYRFDKKELARMLTVLNEKQKNGEGEGKTLKTAAKDSTVRSPRRAKRDGGSRKPAV